jgi:D-aminopeptidase
MKTLLIFALIMSLGLSAHSQNRPRVREAGVKVGILPTGPLNAITDVSGVLVGHTTLVRGDNIRTGVTAIIPHSGNLFREKVPGAVFVGNGFGKLAGSTQVNELGEIETPILLTSTLSVPRVADYLMDYMLSLPGNEEVQSINPLVAETNDGYLNDIRGRHITRDDVFAAIKGRRRLSRRRHRNSRFWFQRRHRHGLAQVVRATRRIHGRRARAVELRRSLNHKRRPGGTGTGSLLLAR